MLNLEPRNFERYYKNVVKVEKEDFQTFEESGFYVYFKNNSYTYLKIECETAIECEEFVNLYKAFARDNFSGRLFEIEYSTKWGNEGAFITIIDEYVKKPRVTKISSQ